MASVRLLKIASLIQTEAANFFNRERTFSLTVIDVEVAADLSLAKIWYESRDAISKREEKALARKFEKSSIRQLFLRRRPRVVLIKDQSSEKVAKVEKLLSIINRQNGKD